MYFRIYYNMKLILPYPKQNCTAKFTAMHKTTQRSAQRVAQKKLLKI